MVAAALMTEPVVGAVRRQLVAAGKGVKITDEQILATLQNLVLKRDVMEGEDATKAKRRMATANRPKKKIEQPTSTEAKPTPETMG
jgi:hypothetical protein